MATPIMVNLPQLCALMGVVLLGARLRHMALAVGLLGITWIILEQHDTRHRDALWPVVAHHHRPRRRLRSPPPPPCTVVEEGYDEEEPPPEPPRPQEPPEGEEDVAALPPVPPPTPPPATRQVSLSGEIVDQYSGRRPRPPGSRAPTTPGLVVSSPDLQVLDRQRLPVASLPQAQRRRLSRVEGTPTHSAYRNNANVSSFAHLR